MSDEKSTFGGLLARLAFASLALGWAPWSEITPQYQERQVIEALELGDPDRGVQRALARELATALNRVSPLDRVELVCSWATSRRDGLRLTAALVLAEPIETLGATSCLEHLAGDPISAIRLATAEAARSRLNGDPVRCRAVLLKLAGDLDRRVARAAQRGLSSAPI